MKDQAATSTLREALASYAPAISVGNPAALRAKVEAFVDAAKAEGWPIERVIVALKEVAAEAGVRSSTDVLRVNSRLMTRDTLLLDAVRWCVEHYFSYSRTGEPRAD
jgi:hypothetical protein